MTIVVGYLPTPEGEAALEAATDEARQRNAHLIVVSGNESVSGNDGASANDDVRANGENISAEQHADALSAKLNELKVANVVVPHDRTVDPAVEILEQAQAHDAELVVIGVRRRSPVGKLLLGSTAQRILLEADCPVLAVKP